MLTGTMQYYKVSGSGNDFLALVEPPEVPSAGEIEAWCRRGVSIGADGLFILWQAGGDAVMQYWNADGLPAKLCINGTRCAARLAFELGWATEQVVVQTGAGPVRARPTGDTTIAIELPPPAEPPADLALEVDGARHRGLFQTVGVPHLVLLWPKSLSAAPVAELGARLRRHPDFGTAGTNVDFVRFPTASTMEIRSFERGVEAETLACGTGVLAATAVGLHLGVATLPLDVLTGGGFHLQVSGEAVDTRPVRWELAGDARIVSRGVLLCEAGVQPPTPQWS
ncbi:MAG: diaminopimelate epimerase [Acidobacteriota bacterium]